MKKRRQLLLALSGASALAGWKKPIINAVSIPAHAISTLPIIGTYSARFYTDNSFAQEIPNGSQIVRCTPYVVVITIFPSPGQPADISVQTVTGDTPNPPVIATANSDGIVAFQVPGAGNCIVDSGQQTGATLASKIVNSLVSVANAQSEQRVYELIAAVKSADPSVLGEGEYSPSVLFFLEIID